MLVYRRCSCDDQGTARHVDGLVDWVAGQSIEGRCAVWQYKMMHEHTHRISSRPALRFHPKAVAALGAP